MANGFPGTTFSPLTAPTTQPSFEDYALTTRRAGLAARQELAGQQEQQAAPAQRLARIAYSPSERKFFVGGYTFDEDDDTAAVMFSKYAGQQAPLPEGDWQDVDDTSYAQYVEGIRDPGMLTLMAKNFGIGVDELQQTVGLGLQFAGATEAGQWLADQPELAKTAIYQRKVEDIGSAGGVLDWMAATLGRFGPNIVESVATAAAGAAAGGAISGPAAPAGAPIGFLAGFFGKTAVKKALMDAAKKQLKGEALEAAEKKLLLSAAGVTSTASNAVKTRMAPAAFAQKMDQALTGGADIVAGAVRNRARQAGGAAGLSLASNVFQQTGQAYGETMEGGGEGDRLTALSIGTIGGLADTAGEFILGSRVLSEVLGDAAGAVSKRRKALNVLGAGGASAGIEGGAEGFQEVLQIAANPVVDFTSPEGQSRLLNALAGGALLGGAFGGAGKFFEGSLADNKQEANLLLPLANNDPAYAQYKQQVRDELGQEEYDKIFNVPRQQDVVSPLAPGYLEGRAAEQAALSPIAGLAPFAGTTAPLASSPQTAQTFNVPPTPPVDMGDPNIRTPDIGMSGTAPASFGPSMQAPTPEGVTMMGATYVPKRERERRFAEAQTRAAQVAAAPTQTVAPDALAQLQNIAMQQTQQAAAAPAPTAAPADIRTGIPQPAAPAAPPLPGGESVNARLLRRGATAQATPRPDQQGTIQQVVEQGPLRMAGAATGVQVPTMAPTRVMDGFPRGGVPGTATGQLVQPLRAAADLKRPASPRGGRADARAFLATIVQAGQNTFTVADLAGYIFPKKTKLNSVDRNRVNAVLDGLIKDKLVSEGPIGTYTVNTEKVRATQPGARAESAEPAGEQAGKDGGTGKGNRLRTRQQKPAEAAPKEQGPATGGEALQQEAGGTPVTVVSTKMVREPMGVGHLVTLSDGRTAKMYKSDPAGDMGLGAWHLDHSAVYGVAPSQPGYVSDVLGYTKKEALENVVKVLDRMEAAAAERAAKSPRKQTTAKAENLKKGSTPERPKGGGGAATPSAKPAKTEAELEADIRKQNAERAAKAAAADREATAKRAEADAAKRAAEAALAEDIRGVREAIVGANNSEGEFLARYIADLIRITKDKEVSEDARTMARDYLKNEVDEDSREYKEAVARAAGKYVDEFRPSRDFDKELLAETISQFNAGKPLGQLAISKSREAWARLKGKNIDPDYEGGKLSDFIDEKNTQFFNVQFTPEGRKVVSKKLEAERKKGRNMLSLFNSVENAVDADGRPLKPIDKVKFKSIVDTFKRGLVRAPQIYVYKNQADLQSRNPTLYQQAVAARPQGDFDTAPAAGYSFGDDKVIIFSDRIATPQMLRLVLAHEAIGHFGLRSLMPVKQFDALMDYVYENSPLARQIADAEVEINGMDRREAVEEYLANYASYLDTSMLGRIISAIKTALNKLGIRFEDDISRYLVNQARRYTREGADFFLPDTFIMRAMEVERSITGSGRYNIPTLLPWQRDLAFKLTAPNAMPSSISDVQSAFKSANINSTTAFDNFVRKFFRLANYDALRNHGAAAYDTLINAVRTNVAALRNQYNEEFADVMGLNQESRDALSYALYTGRSIAHQRLKFDATTRSIALVKIVDGQVVADQAALDKFIKMGTLSKKELDDGATVTVQVPVAGNKFKPDKVEIEGVRAKLGRDLTDAEYDLYVKSRRRLANIEVELLKARYDNYLTTEKVTLKGVRKILTDGTMTESDMVFVRNIINHAKVLISQSIEYDAQGLPTTTSEGLSRSNAYLAKVNEAIIKSNEKFTEALKDEVRAFYTSKEQANATIAALEKFRERRRTISEDLSSDIVYAIQNRIKEVVLADQMFDKAQSQARRTIAQGYIPVFREGGWQIRVEAQAGNETVTLHPDVQNKLILTLMDKRADSEVGAAELNKEFAGKTVEMLALQSDGTYAMQKVKLFARASKTIDDVAADPSLDIDNFIHGLRMFGIATNPQAIEKVIVSLTNPGSALRKALRFDDVPGYDMRSGITALSRHIVTRASLIAKTRYQPSMRELLDRTSDRGSMWFGDKEAVIRAKEAMDAATDPREREFHKRDLTVNLYKYVMTNPGAKGWDGSRATFPAQPGQADIGMTFYNNAIATQQWLEGSENVAESTFEGKRVPAVIKAVTSVAFLGGSMAQFVQNLLSPVTNTIPYLATKNGKTGFGGGFGYIQSVIEYNRAFKDAVGLRGLIPFSDQINEANYYFDIAKKYEVARAANDTAEQQRLYSEYKLTYFEARNIGQEIREGKLIPAQANAVLETSRGVFSGSTGGRFWMKFTDYYMIPFNISEQGARRATFLAAFRLEFNRLKNSNVKDKDGKPISEEQISERARTFATDAVDLTLGEYSNTNRPPAWREGWQSLLYMYKTYPTTAVLLAKNMSWSGKVGMLAALWMLTGISGFPFAEDVEDLLDTLAQRFGLDIGQGPSLRVFLSKQIDEMFPGLAPYVIKGFANQFIPADIASRTGVGNILPGTGFLMAGSDPTHELAEVAGPLGGMAVNLAKATYEAVQAPLSERATLVDALRAAPVSLFRSVGDIAMYMQTGAIVDKRGYVVSPEVTGAQMLTRLLGFYPVAAANQYEVIKFSRRVTEYQKQVSMGYRDAWIKAKATGDREHAARIAKEVQEWNEATKGTELYLRNWMKNSMRAWKEARRPATERFLRSTPQASRASLERYMDAATAE